MSSSNICVGVPYFFYIKLPDFIFPNYICIGLSREQKKNEYFNINIKKGLQ